MIPPELASILGSAMFQRIVILLEIAGALLLAAPIMDPGRLDRLLKRLDALLQTLTHGTVLEAKAMRWIRGLLTDAEDPLDRRHQQWMLGAAYVLGFGISAFFVLRTDFLDAQTRWLLPSAIVAIPLLLVGIGAVDARLKPGPVKTWVLNLLQAPFVLLLMPGIVVFCAFVLEAFLARLAIARLMRPLAAAFAAIRGGLTNQRLAISGLVLMLLGLALQFAATFVPAGGAELVQSSVEDVAVTASDLPTNTNGP